MWPTFSPEGYQETGQVGYGYIARGDDVNSFTGSVTKIFRGHNLKMGARGSPDALELLPAGYPQGHFSFSRATTNEDPNQSSSFQGNAIASMLIGWGSGGDYRSIRRRHPRRDITAFMLRTTGRSAAS